MAVPDLAVIPAGARDRRVTILAAASSDDGFTSAPGAFAEIGARWASKRDVSDRERFAAGQQGASVTTRFQLPWDGLTAAITTAHQLRCEGATYTISAVKEIGRREGVELTAARRDDGGI